MADINKEELEKEIEKILDNAELAKMTTKKVIQQLEKILGAKLASRKEEIDKMVMDYVNNQPSERFNKPVETSEDEQEEIEKKKSRSQKVSKVSEDNSDKSEEEKKPTKKKTRKRKGSNADSDDDWAKKKKGAGGARRAGTGFTRSYRLSPALQQLMGKDHMPRHEVVKRIWEIIKKNNLYDPNNKHFAVCDEALYKVFGVKRFRAFGMMKYLKTHFIGD